MRPLETAAHSSTIGFGEEDVREAQVSSLSSCTGATMCGGPSNCRTPREGEVPSTKGICLEADSSVRKITWSHVGEGRGAYERVDKFTYVGKGAGDHISPEVDWVRRGCLCFMVALVGALMIMLLSWSHMLPGLDGCFGSGHEASGSGNTAPSGGGLRPGAAVQFDCKAGFAQWERDWPLDKKDWCCRYRARGCPPDHHYDCEDGLERWVDAWDLGKKNYCCGYDHKGCESVAPKAKPGGSFNCEQDLQDWESKWSSQKKSYCCKVFDFGCQAHDIPVPYNCQEGLADWAKSWESGKKSWCCEHEHVCSAEPAAPKDTPGQGSGGQAAPAPAVTVDSIKVITPDPSSVIGGGNQICENLCTVSGYTASCKARVKWLVEQPAPAGFRGEAESCQFALDKVLIQCAECAGCAFMDVGCIAPM